MQDRANTLIEVLSPSNKRPASEGGRIYREKQQEIDDGLRVRRRALESAARGAGRVKRGEIFNERYRKIDGRWYLSYMKVNLYHMSPFAAGVDGPRSGLVTFPHRNDQGAKRGERHARISQP